MFKAFLKKWLGFGDSAVAEECIDEDDENALLGKSQGVLIPSPELETWLIERLVGRGGLQALRLQLLQAGTIRFGLRFKLLGKIDAECELADLWHDEHTSSIELKLLELNTAEQGGKGRMISWLLLVLPRLLHLLGTFRTSEGISLRLSPDMIHVDLRGHVAATVSPRYQRLRRNLAIIGAEVGEGHLRLHIHRMPFCLQDEKTQQEETFFSPRGGYSRIMATWHWLLLIAYVFILIHLTFPVVQRAFSFVYSDTGQGMRFLWSFIYDIFVLVISFFFLRLTMFPFYVHWWRYKHEVRLLRAEEAKDRQYLRILDRWFKDFREMYHELSRKRNKKALVQYRRQLRDAIHDVGKQRRQLAEKQEYLDAQNWNWMRQILVGYVVAFGLEWLYINEILPPLEMTLDWVNQVMAWLLR